MKNKFIKTYETFIDDNYVVVSQKYKDTPKKKYLIALPTFPNEKGFNHRTILVSAIDENDARKIVKHLKPHDNIGDIKEIDY